MSFALTLTFFLASLLVSQSNASASVKGDVNVNVSVDDENLKKQAII